MEKAYLFLAEGFEEVEALMVVDIVRRGGANIQTVSITNSLNVTGSHNITVKADVKIDDIKKEDVKMYVLPGGLPGAQNLADSEKVINLLKAHDEKKGMICAICSSPSYVLSKLGRNMKITCYPGTEKMFPNATIVDKGIVRDENIITAKGLAYVESFGLSILFQLTDEKTANSVAKGMLLNVG